MAQVNGSDVESLLGQIANCLKEMCFDDSSALRVDQTTEGDISITLLGWAPAGTDPDATGWRIAQVYQDDDGSGNVQTVKSWAETISGASDWMLFNKTWSDRNSYIYVFSTP